MSNTGQFIIDFFPLFLLGAIFGKLIDDTVSAKSIAGSPKRLIPGALALGAFSFTMSALPGTPAIQNAIPMRFFGNTAFASPGLGSIASIIMFVVGACMA
jgi:H+/gluconate symporter-like permease